MPNGRRTLLDIASGGQYKTSKDLPDFKELIDLAAARQAVWMSEEAYPGSGVTQGNLYDMVMGVASVAPIGRGIKGVVGGVKKLRSIQKLRNQKEVIKNISKHSISKKGSTELKQIGKELDTYLGPQRSSKIVKQGGNQNAKSIRQADRKKHEQLTERLEKLTKEEGGLVRTEYEKGLDLGSPKAATQLTQQQQIARQKRREEKRLFRELGGSRRGKQKGGSIL
jgi:hypothetical protein